jgi:hypothetical protein
MNITDTIFKYFFIVRILATPLLFYTKDSIPHTVLLLITLDLIDRYTYKHGDIQNHTFNVIDKLVDVFQYCVAIYFLSPKLPKKILHIIMGFTLVRLIGIFHHAKTTDPTYFVVFFDFIKEYLILFYIYYPNLTMLVVIEAVIIKVIIEYLIHKHNFFRSLYMTLTE